MTATDQNNIENWNDFQKRVIAAESHHNFGFLPSVKSACLIAIILGILLILLHKFAISLLVIRHFGVLLIAGSILVLFAIHWVNSGSSVIKKEREKNIQERGISRRCKYLSGTLPDGLNPAAGSCSLYNQALTAYPYCIYCKSYYYSKNGGRS